MRMAGKVLAIGILLFIGRALDWSGFLPDHAHILLATLGGQPQVVTFTLDLLLKEGFPISEVIVIHPKTSQPRLQRSLQLLAAEFPGDCYKVANRVIHFRSHVLQLDGTAIDDIIDDAHADG